MKQGIRLNSPALAVSLVALFAALGGTVYAAAERINGKVIKVKSLPGNRLKPHSVPANRLKPGVLGTRLSGPLTGADINELTLGQVPSAAQAESAETAQRAVEAGTAESAVNAINAETVNGHSAGCQPGTQPFAGACWQSSASELAATAPDAAAECAALGGTLPEALQLAAFAGQPGVNLDAGDEWSGDIPVVSGPGVYAVVTVSAASEVSYQLASTTRHYRCVIPLVV